MLTRRALFAVLAGAALDPERLLWRPGRKLISIPAPREDWYVTIDPGEPIVMPMVQFHDQVFALTMEPLPPGVLETALREMNAMIDRWNDAGYLADCARRYRSGQMDSKLRLWP